MHFNKQRWNLMLTQLNIQSNYVEYEKLDSTYSEKHRFYHTKQHISDCLGKLDWAASMEHLDNMAEVEMALWYHDAIYDPKGKDNELASAKLCKAFLVNSGVENDQLETIQHLIMATKHAALPRTESEKLVVDIDLSILGENQERFQEYELQILKEYQWVPWFLYRKKRREILTNFLNRPRIYFTDIFCNALEDQARINIKNSITNLLARPD